MNLTFIDSALTVLSAVTGVLGIVGAVLARRRLGTSGYTREEIRKFANALKAGAQRVGETADRAFSEDDVSWALVPELSGKRGRILVNRFRKPARPAALASLISEASFEPLIIVGPAGSGKTALARWLATQLTHISAHALDGQTAPMLVALHGWNPRHQSAEEFITGTAVRVARWRRRNGAAIVGHLVERGLLLPILDGLDEMPEELRAEALSRITASRVGHQRYLLTSRTEEFVRAQESLAGAFDALVVRTLGSSRLPTAATAVADVIPGALSGEIQAEVMKLPEVRIALAYAGPDAPDLSKQIRRSIDEILRYDGAAVREAGDQAWSRFRAAQRRMIEALPHPPWLKHAIRQRPILMAIVGTALITPFAGRLPWLLGAALCVVGVVLMAARLASRRWLARRPRWFGDTVAGLAATLVGGGFVYWATAGQPIDLTRAWTLMLAFAALSIYALLLSWPYEQQCSALSSRDPARWPRTPGLTDHRALAEQAHRDWLSTLAREGVLPRLPDGLLFAGDRNGTTLPELELGRVGGELRPDEHVDTLAADRITRLVQDLGKASIGVSGPRGAGKSTLLQRFCRRQGARDTENRQILVAAPTAYDRRDFLVHLFTEVCRDVLAETRAIPRRPITARVRAVAPEAAIAGSIALLAGAAAWPDLVALAALVAAAVVTHPRETCISAGTAAIVLALWTTWRRNRRTAAEPPGPLRIAAIAHLDRLAYQTTTSRGADGKVGLPLSAEVGVSSQVERTEHLRSYPELVADFREFLQLLADDRRINGTGKIIIGIDELDKMASGADAEQFLNDIKAVFGIDRCYFLVSVSDETLTTFDQRTLAMRSTFDSAFDAIVQVAPMTSEQASRLVGSRGVSLPDSFLWLCHALSGGLPRDLLRCVLNLHQVAAETNDRTLAGLARRVITEDLARVTAEQLARANRDTDSNARAVRDWLATAALAQPGVQSLTGLLAAMPTQANAQPTTAQAAQVRAYLYHALVLWHVFVENPGFMLTPEGVDLLASARAALATRPATSLVLCQQFANLVAGSPPLPAVPDLPPPRTRSRPPRARQRPDGAPV